MTHMRGKGRGKDRRDEEEREIKEEGRGEEACLLCAAKDILSLYLS